MPRVIYCQSPKYCSISSCVSFVWAMKELTIPAELDGIPVTVIGWPTLRAGVKKVIIPEGITTLRQFTLGSSTVRTVELPRSLVSVEDGAFRSCENLREIKLAKDHPALEYTKGMLFSSAQVWA